METEVTEPTAIEKPRPGTFIKRVFGPDSFIRKAGVVLGLEFDNLRLKLKHLFLKFRIAVLQERVLRLQRRNLLVLGETSREPLDADSTCDCCQHGRSVHIHTCFSIPTSEEHKAISVLSGLNGHAWMAIHSIATDLKSGVAVAKRVNRRLVIQWGESSKPK